MRKIVILITCTILVMFSCSGAEAEKQRAKNELATKYKELYLKAYNLRHGGGEQAAIEKVEKEMQAIYSQVNPLEKYDPPITLTGVRFLSGARFPQGETHKDNRWTRAYKEKLGINIEWKWITEVWDTYIQKMNIMIATGEVPDFGEAEQESMIKIWKASKSKDLAPYFPWLREELRNALHKHPVGLKTIQQQGAVPAIPKIRWPSLVECLWMRSDWLDRLGLDKPKSMKEFINVARQFSKNDPDGNGKDDTIGMPLDGVTISAQGFYHGYGSYPFGNMWVTDKKNKDKLMYGGVTDETREALMALKGMIDEGLVDKEWSILAKSMINEDCVAGRCGILYGAHWSPIFPLEKSVRENPEAEWVWVDFPKKGGGIARDAVEIAPQNFYFVGRNCENPEALLKMMSFNYEMLVSENQQLQYHTDMETDIQVFKYAFGIIGEGKRNNATIAKMITEAITTDRKFEGHGLLDIDRKYFDGCMNYLKGDLSGWAMWHTFGPASFNLRMNWHIDNEYYQLNKYYGQVLEAWVDKGMTLEKFRDEKIVEFLTGDRSLDEWQSAYVDKWYELGGQDATNEANQWWEDIR